MQRASEWRRALQLHLLIGVGTRSDRKPSIPGDKSFRREGVTTSEVQAITGQPTHCTADLQGDRHFTSAAAQSQKQVRACDTAVPFEAWSDLEVFTSDPD